MSTEARGAVSAAVSTGDRLDVLMSMRDQLARALDDGAAPRDLAALTRRLSDVDAEVRSLQAENDPVANARAGGGKAWTA